MARAGLDKETVIRKAAELANEIGYDKITLKLLAEHLNVQPPSLYNHIKGIEELQKEIMLLLEANGSSYDGCGCMCQRV